MSEKRIIDNVNVNSRPSDLRITDVRFLDISGAPMRCTIVKIMTNQGIEGYGEIRDGAHRLYGEMLKSRILGENPCDIDRLFRRIKQFGGHARQGGGVCGIEIALWDIAAKAYGIPIYQMLGGKFRDKVRVYCDTDVHGRHTGKDMGKALQERIDMGFTFLKMDLGIGLLRDIPGALCAPGGFLGQANDVHQMMRDAKTPEQKRWAGHRAYDYINVAHNFTGISITTLGLDWLENYVKEVREVIGYDLPLALDHFGHIGIDSCIQLAKRLEAYNIAWAEDMVPWQDTASYAKLNNQVALPVCTGEDIYLKENFLPLLKADGVQVIHPDILTCGGILELKKIGDMAQDYGVAMAIHMAETPIACLAAAHVATATENFLALEFHSVETPWWDDMVNGPTKPIIKDGFITLDDKPGLGIESLNDEVLAQHLNPTNDGMWDDTSNWDDWESHDRLWS